MLSVATLYILYPQSLEFACVLGLSYKSVFVLTNHKAAFVIVVSCSDKSIYIYFAALMFAWETFILSNLWRKEL